MRKLSPLLVAVLLGAAMVSIGAPYDLAADISVINQSPAHEVIKADARQTAMFEAFEQPALVPGTALVSRRRPTDRVGAALGVIVGWGSCRSSFPTI